MISGPGEHSFGTGLIDLFTWPILQAMSGSIFLNPSLIQFWKKQTRAEGMSRYGTYIYAYVLQGSE